MNAANTIALTPLDLMLAASLLVINAAISWAFGLRLERGIAFAATRMDRAQFRSMVPGLQGAAGSETLS